MLPFVGALCKLLRQILPPYLGTAPSQFGVHTPLVDRLELSQDQGVLGFQELDVMAVGIAGEERDAGDVRQEEQVRPLDGGVVAQSHLRDGPRTNLF